MKNGLLTIFTAVLCVNIYAQEDTISFNDAWVDSVFNECFNKQYVFDSTKMNENEWLDSIFYANFNKMRYAIDSNMMYDTHVDRIFVYLLSYISGIECATINYSGFCYFDVEKLKEWVKWYEKNKDELLAEKVIWGLNFLKSNHKTQQGWDTLHNLKIP